MADTPKPDYFTSPVHEERVKVAIERERARLLAITELNGPMAAISDAIGSMSAHTAIFRSLGLKKVAVNLLKSALDLARKE